MVHRRLVVFTGDLSLPVRKGIVEIDRCLPHTSWLILISEPKRSPGQILANQWRMFRRNGWRLIPYRVVDGWQQLNRRFASRNDEAISEWDVTFQALESQQVVQIIRAHDIHASEVLDIVQSFQPDLGLSIGAPILRRPLFTLPRLGTVNLHKGKVPEYRGMPPAFWELWNDEQSVGCTVHWVDEKLDTGDIVGQSSVNRARFSTLAGLQLQLDEVGVDLMCRTVRDIFAGIAQRIPQGGHGKTYRKPTLAQVTALDANLRELQPPAPPLLTRLLKRARSEAGFVALRAGLVKMLPPRVTVLLYHRVTDEVRDDLTVGIEQFDRQMALVRKYCQPVSLRDIIDTSVISRSDKPLVAVTFDDGYEDNYLNAAPILMNHGIPAAFFVSTGIVDSGGRFPHDIQRGNPPIPVMTWEQLREMHRWGFVIGSHTVEHIDCAAEGEETVRRELARSRDQLQQELGVDELLFAYPYGGRQHITPQRLDLVRQAGFSGCLSAYGGTNIGSIDRYNMLRRGIHWEFSDSAFLFECTGLR